MAPKDTVTISKEEFQALLDDMKLMKQQLTSEDRQRAFQDRKQIAEEEARRRLEEANAKAMEPVEIYVDLGNLRGNKNLNVSINGRQYVVPRGKAVMVPRCVAEVIENAKKQREIAYALQEKRAKEFERESVAYAS